MIFLNKYLFLILNKIIKILKNRNFGFIFILINNLFDTLINFFILINILFNIFNFLYRFLNILKSIFDWFKFNF